jgi:pimeloyl-ACP methyl ester carboxylesterase
MAAAGAGRTGTARWRWVAGGVLLGTLVVAALWTWWAESHPREERRLRVLVHEQLRTWFPEEMAPADGWHGLYARAGTTPGDAMPVLLVHGLDEPGSIWDDLVPALHAAGHAVWELRYPNDQGIDRSADFLAAQWSDLPPDQPVAIVGHSMGGLVARDFVSRLWRKGVPGPAVAGVILVGTPNQGSEWARLRVWLELRDHFPTSEGRRFSLFAALRDGAGEAKIDLRPGSDFLDSLDARPWPEGVPIVAIAGRLVAPPADLAAGFATAAAETGSAALKQELSDWWSGIGEDLGDGVVRLASAGLPGGPPPLVVEASHRGMIARLLPGDPDPPAIALILAELRNWEPGTRAAASGVAGELRRD